MSSDNSECSTYNIYNIGLFGEIPTDDAKNFADALISKDEKAIKQFPNLNDNQKVIISHIICVWDLTDYFPEECCKIKVDEEKLTLDTKKLLDIMKK